MLHHFHGHSLFDGGPLRNWTPQPLHWLLERGNGGVVIFFCLSGYVIAHSLAGKRLTPGGAGNFLLRRSIRLDPPYFATIALALIANAASNPFLKERFVPFPEPGYLLSHFAYLQEVIYGHSILGAFWTLCLEVQLYLSFALLTVLAHACVRRDRPDTPRRLQRAAVWAVLPVALGSLYWPLSGLPEMPRSGWLFFYWYLFLIGVFLRWSQDDRSARAGLALLLLGAAVAAARGDNFAGTALLTALFILIARAAGGMETWLRWRWLQYLGGISYSLYLLHDIFGVRILNLSTRLPARNLAAEIGLFLLACGSSIAAAHLMNRYIERPFMRLSKKLKPRRAAVETGAAGD